MLSKSDVSLSLTTCVDVGVDIDADSFPTCSSPSPSPSPSPSSSLITEKSSPCWVAFSSSSFRCNDINFLEEGKRDFNPGKGWSSFASASWCASNSSSSSSACLKSGSDTCVDSDSGFKLPNLPLMRGTGPAKNAFSFPSHSKLNEFGFWELCAVILGQPHA